MDEPIKKRVLVCTLGWGLGHASRCIPIIKKLQGEGFKLIIAGDNLQLNYLLSFFPSIETIYFPSFKVRLSKGRSQLFPLIWIALRLPYHIAREHYAIKKIANKHSIDIIISDNRYGLWCKGVKTVLITHQLRILFPNPFKFLEPVGEWFVRTIAKRFDKCWVPDFSDQVNLAGKLSHPIKLPKNARYIGILSRFTGVKHAESNFLWDLVAIVSGPSPQRELLIAEIEGVSKKRMIKTLIIKGNPDEGDAIIEQNGIWYAGHLKDDEFVSAVKSSKYLICRAGYSTIMDMMALGVKCIVVPTPGQTEQEYLAEHLSMQGLFFTCKQNELGALELSSNNRENSSAVNSNLIDKEIELLSV